MTTQVSLIITVLNEESSLSEWFDSLLGMSKYPDELVICDGGSTDSTREIITAWTARSPFPIHLEMRAGANISQGRNAAIERASHEWVAVTDAGTKLDREWLSALLAASEASDVVSGFFHPTGSKPFERFLATIVTFRLDEIDPDSFLPSSRSLLIRRSAWMAVGGYPEWLDYCEDLVFDIALRSAGFRFAFAPRALVSWSARSTPRAFAKQYYRYGRGDGKAGLFLVRQLTRYTVYGTGVIVLILAAWKPVLLAPLTIGALMYNYRYFRRLARGRHLVGKLWWLWAFAVVPTSALGDVAKMLGYPVGVLWRRRTESTRTRPEHV